MAVGILSMLTLATTSGRARTLRLATLLVLANLACLCQFANAAEPGTREQLMKSAFLYNFSKFVEWPNTANQDRSAFAVCILGDNPYGGAISSIQGKDVKGLPVAIKLLSDETKLDECKLVFVGQPFSRDPAALIERWQSQPILLVADSADFAKAGGDIGMYVQENKIRFTINEKAIRERGLEVSSRLLGVAAEVIR